MKDTDMIASDEQLATSLNDVLDTLPLERRADALKAAQEYLDTAGPGNHVSRIRMLILEWGEE